MSRLWVGWGEWCQGPCLLVALGTSSSPESQCGLPCAVGQDCGPVECSSRR